MQITICSIKLLDVIVDQTQTHFYQYRSYKKVECNMPRRYIILSCIQRKKSYHKLVKDKM